MHFFFRGRPLPSFNEDDDDDDGNEIILVFAFNVEMLAVLYR
jgi:hypothetical protein